MAYPNTPFFHLFHDPFSPNVIFTTRLKSWKLEISFQIVTKRCAAYDQYLSRIYLSLWSLSLDVMALGMKHNHKYVCGREGHRGPQSYNLYLWNVWVTHLESYRPDQKVLWWHFFVPVFIRHTSSALLWKHYNTAIWKLRMICYALVELIAICLLLRDLLSTRTSDQELSNNFLNWRCNY